MSISVDGLLTEALSLPADERAILAAELIASLDEPFEDPREVERAWALEIKRRLNRALANPEDSEDWSLVRERLLSQHRGR